MLRRLVLGQHFAGSHDYFVRQSRELGDFDAITLVGRARLDLAEEDYASAGFFNRHMVVLYATELLGQFGQLEIVSGEQSLGMHAGTEIFDCGPGNGKAIIGGSAATDFVEQDERTRRRGMQDGGGLGHLDHEGGSSPGEVVAGPDAGEDAIHDAESRRAGRNKRSHLREDHDQRCLP